MLTLEPADARGTSSLARSPDDSPPVLSLVCARDSARRCHICARTRLALGLGSPLPRLRQDSARRCHICAGTDWACAAQVFGQQKSTPRPQLPWQRAALSVVGGSELEAGLLRRRTPGLVRHGSFLGLGPLPSGGADAAPAGASPYHDRRGWGNVGAETTVRVVGLSPGRAYVFRVAAAHVESLGAFSAVSAPIRTACCPPSVPLNLRVTMLTPKTADLAWTLPLCDGGLPRGPYSVRVNCVDAHGAGADTGLVDESASASLELKTPTTAVVSGLQPGTMYTFQLGASNDLGFSEWSQPTQPALTQTCISDVPTVIGVHEATPNSLLLAWAPPMCDGGLAILRYEVQVQAPTPFPLIELVTKPEGSADTVSLWTGAKLKPNNEYTFRVRAENRQGLSSWSLWSNPVRTLPTVPDMPRGFEVGAHSRTHARTNTRTHGTGGRAHRWRPGRTTRSGSRASSRPAGVCPSHASAR